MPRSPSKTSTTTSSRASDVEQAILDGAHQIALPGAGLDAVDLHRVRADVPARRHRQVSVHSAGRGGGVRDARLVPAVAHAGSDAGEILAQEEGRRPRTARRARSRVSRRRSSAASSACATAIASCSSLAIDGGVRFAAIFLLAMAAAALLAFPLGPLPGLGQDFFPTVDAGPAQAALAGEHRHAHRGDRRSVRSGGGDHARNDPAGRDHLHRGQSWGCPTAASISRTARRRRSGPGDADIFINFAKKHSFAGRLSARAARASLAASYPVDAVRVPAGRHRQPDLELRPALAARRAGRRARTSRRTARSFETLLPKLIEHPGRGRPAHPAALRLPADQRRRGSQQGAVSRAHRSRTSHPTCSSRLSGSFQTSPSFWIDPKTGTQYNVVAQTPQFRLDLAQRSRQHAAQPDGRVHAGRGRHLADPVERRHHASQRRARRGEPLQRSGRHSTSTATCRARISVSSPRSSTR